VNPPPPNRISVMAPGSSEHDLGMINSEDEPPPGHVRQNFYGRPRSAAEIQDRVAG